LFSFGHADRVKDPILVGFFAVCFLILVDWYHFDGFGLNACFGLNLFNLRFFLGTSEKLCDRKLLHSPAGERWNVTHAGCENMPTVCTYLLSTLHLHDHIQPLTFCLEL